MSSFLPIFLGVNIDHIATLRQARLTSYPDLIQAVHLIEHSNGDSITLHLREDRRHILDKDVFTLKNIITTKMNLEMAATDEMIAIACEVKPQDCCLVPEKREELTTEGGLDIVARQSYLARVYQTLANYDIRVSFFIDADIKQVNAVKAIGASIIELHTGHYANAKTSNERNNLLNIIKEVASYADHLGIQVNAGHGLHLDNTADIARIPQIVELNIGHAIITRSIFVGLSQAVKEMKVLIQDARN